MPRQTLLVMIAVPLFVALSCTDLPTTANLRPMNVRAAFNDVDLNPGADGYFVQGTAPELCFWGHNWDVRYNDADDDWVDDGCEFLIASAFAPVMRLHSSENCPNWQPYWAAKAFSNPRRMRIAYMPAYHQDCGLAESHYGDSELVTVQILHDPASNHWMVESVWFSAHYNTPADQSVWGTYYNIEYPDRYRGRPRVWVALKKHANYQSLSGCIGGELMPAHHCNGSYWQDRPFPVHADRNVGSRSEDLVGCVYAQPGGLNGGSGRCERFYYFNGTSPFKGWFADDEKPPAGAYHGYLMSDKFELYDAPAGGTDDWGPDAGTLPPPGPNLNLQIVGPDAIEAGNGCQWYATVTGGNPTSYEWTVNGAPAGSSESLWYTNTGTNFEIGVVVQTDNGSIGAFKAVAIVQGSGCT